MKVMLSLNRSWIHNSYQRLPPYKLINFGGKSGGKSPWGKSPDTINVNFISVKDIHFAAECFCFSWSSVVELSPCKIRAQIFSGSFTSTPRLLTSPFFFLGPIALGRGASDQSLLRVVLYINIVNRIKCVCGCNYTSLLILAYFASVNLECTCKHWRRLRGDWGDDPQNLRWGDVPCIRPTTILTPIFLRTTLLFDVSQSTN